MTPAQLTAFLHENIALTRAIGVQVTDAETDRVRLVAPLQPNLNHHGTAFGGSLATIGILAGWVALHHALSEAGIDASLVIRKTVLDYLQPVTGDLVAECRLPAQEWMRFSAQLRHGRRARIQVDSVLRCGDADAMRAHGTYVALPPQR